MLHFESNISPGKLQNEGFALSIMVIRASFVIKKKCTQQCCLSNLVHFYLFSFSSPSHSWGFEGGLAHETDLLLLIPLWKCNKEHGPFCKVYKPQRWCWRTRVRETFSCLIEQTDIPLSASAAFSSTLVTLFFLTLPPTLHILSFSVFSSCLYQTLTC